MILYERTIIDKKHCSGQCGHMERYWDLSREQSQRFGALEYTKCFTTGDLTIVYVPCPEQETANSSAGPCRYLNNSPHELALVRLCRWVTYSFFSWIYSTKFSWWYNHLLRFAGKTTKFRYSRSKWLCPCSAKDNTLTNLDVSYQELKNLFTYL